MIFVHQCLKKSFSECQNMAGTNSGVSDGSMDGGKGIPSEASRMLEAALQQMDGIIQGAKFELPQFDNFSLQVLFDMVDFISVSTKLQNQPLVGNSSKIEFFSYFSCRSICKRSICLKSPDLDCDVITDVIYNCILWFIVRCLNSKNDVLR